MMNAEYNVPKVGMKALVSCRNPSGRFWMLKKMMKDE